MVGTSRVFCLAGGAVNQLVEFSIENFRSIKERVTLSLVASKKLVSQEPTVDEGALFEVDEDLTLLKSIAIYGANASGKSNVMAAMNVMKGLVLNSSKETAATQMLPVEPFRLDEKTISRPSSFEVVFLNADVTYRYGFEATTERITGEWLFASTGSKEQKLFVRTGDEIKVSRSRTFKEGKGLEERTRVNALFLSVVAQFNGPVAVSIQKWFASSLKTISGLDDAGYLGFTISRCDEDEWRQSIASFVRALDVGIEDVSVSKIPLRDSLPHEMPPEIRQILLSRGDREVARISTTHSVYAEDGRPVSVSSFDFETQESEGTKKVFALAGPLIDTLRHGRVLFVDEIDARLHPLLTIEIIRLFNSRETNRLNAQLVFTTHDTNVLQSDVLRRDQVWFTEKNRFGASSLYSLLEYKPRNDSSLAKNYMQGRYGAIPILGALSSFMKSEVADAK
jgi:AAA15 family ATPase/GTPase